MTTNITDFDDNLLDSDVMDFSGTTDMDGLSPQHKKLKAGLRRAIDAYLEEKQLKNDLRDIFEDDFY